MLTSLSSLVDNLSEIYSKKCRDKICKSKCEFIGLKRNRLYYKCNECKKRQVKPINGLIKKFPNIYQFCNEDINKLVLLLKGVFPYEYMDSWERFAETLLLNKKAFYIEVYLGDIIDEDYTYTRKGFEEFNLKNLGDYHDLYL